jgi:hypothetical protein
VFKSLERLEDGLERGQQLAAPLQLARRGVAQREGQREPEALQHAPAIRVRARRGRLLEGLEVARLHRRADLEVDGEGRQFLSTGTRQLAGVGLQCVDDRFQERVQRAVTPAALGQRRDRGVGARPARPLQV